MKGRADNKNYCLLKHPVCLFILRTVSLEKQRLEHARNMPLSQGSEIDNGYCFYNNRDMHEHCRYTRQ